MNECVFCKIIKKELPSDVVFENDNIIVFKDINPKATLHLLVVPKEHIASIKELEEENKSLIGELILVAKKIAKEQNLTGYKLIFNVGREGGQLIDHLHLHLLSGDVKEIP
jgi:histidine triad (HIT) family protein